MDYPQNVFLPNPEDFSQFMNPVHEHFNETSGAYSSSQNHAFDHAPPVHNRTEPCQIVIDKFAGGIDLDHSSHPSFHAPYMPRFPIGDFSAPTNLLEHDRQMNMGCSPPAISPVNPNVANFSPLASFAIDPRRIGGQLPSVAYPPSNSNQPYSLHQTCKAKSNPSNFPLSKPLAKGLGSGMPSVPKRSSPRSSPCPPSAQVKSPSTLHSRDGKRRCRPRHRTGAKAAPQGTYIYQCRWGPCKQLIHGDRNSIRKHLKEYHAVPVDKTLVTCFWKCTCGDEMRGDSIPRHIEVHLDVQWVCSKCDVRLSRRDSGWRHTDRNDGMGCPGATIYELPGPGAQYFSPNATSVC